MNFVILITYGQLHVENINTCIIIIYKILTVMCNDINIIHYTQYYLL